MDWGMFSAIGGLIGLQTVLLIWMMSKLDSDIKSVSADSNTKWVAVNARLDQSNARLDQTQAIIMRMLERQGK